MSCKSQSEFAILIIILIAMDAELHCEVQSVLGHIGIAALKKFLDVPAAFECSGSIYSMMVNRLRGNYLYYNTKRLSNAKTTEEIAKGVRQYSPELEEGLHKLLTDDFYKRLLASLTQKAEDKAESVSLSKKAGTVKEPALNKPSATLDQTKKKKQNAVQIDLQIISDAVETKLHIDNDPVTDISEGECLCRKVVSDKQEGTFRCVHCSYHYHQACLRKTAKNSTPQCLPCHLKLINPNRPVKKTVFLGLLRKDRKNHDFSFKLAETDFEKGQRLEVRCFRLKEGANSFILFPDYAKIEVNETLVREFIPLHKLSSLKYRKDEALMIDIKRSEKLYRVKVSEELPRKETKEDRIESADHLIAFYLITDKGVKTICQEIEENCLTTFSESMGLLNSLMKTDSSGKNQEVSVQMQVIPLVCPLSSERVKVPVRGLFCTHFQCFDLQNYLVVVSNTANPRWVCPLCKKPSYSLRVDCIIAAIIAECRCGAQTPKEIKLYRNGQFEASPSAYLLQRRPLSSLNIESMRKRRGEQPFRPSQPSKRQAKQSVVICLD